MFKVEIEQGITTIIQECEHYFVCAEVKAQDRRTDEIADYTMYFEYEGEFPSEQDVVKTCKDYLNRLGFWYSGLNNWFCSTVTVDASKYYRFGKN